MESVEIEETAEETVECDCKPFTLVRYRDGSQEPSFVDEATSVYIDNGAVFITGKNDLTLLVAPLDTVLSIEHVTE